MGAPRLTITPIAIIPAGSVIDLTALTGGINGETGADYNCGVNIAQKLDGNNRCMQYPVGAIQAGGQYGTGITLNVSDRDPNTQGPIASITVASPWVAPAGLSTPVGFKFLIDAADQRIGQFYWHGSTYNSRLGDWVATASVSDGSSPNAVYTLPGRPNFDGNVVQMSFRMDFAGVAPDATVTLQFLKTNPAGGPSNCGSHVCYTLPTVPAPSPTGLILGMN